MEYLIGALVTLGVALVGYALLELRSGRERSSVTRRLEELGVGASRAGAGEPRRVDSARARLQGVLRSLGERFVANRRNLDQLRETLSHAGYRGPNVLPMYFALRAVLMAGLVLLDLVLVPLATDSALAPLLALPYFVLMAWLAPRFVLARQVTARQTELRRALPDTLDLLVVCVEAGLGLNQALVRVSREIGKVSEVMSAELRLLNLEIQAGTPRAEAFRNLGLRTGLDDIRSMATMMIQADRFGTSVAQALRVQAETLRTKRRQRAEEAAAKTTIQLVFPLVLFIFPALFVIILGPAVISIIRQMAGT